MIPSPLTTPCCQENNEDGRAVQMTGYCEDYPCCGHTDSDPCPGRGAPVDEAWYCDDCGMDHRGLCPMEVW